MRLVARCIGPFALAMLLAAVPLAQVAACDCAMVELPEAVRTADVAFVGTLVDHVPGGDNFGFPPEDEWHWSVDRSRDTGLDSTIVVKAAMENGANCGVIFGIQERWLVLASAQDGVLQTNGCVPNRRVDLGSDPETEAIVRAFSDVTPGAQPSDLSVPMPVLVGIGAVGIIGLVAAVAFRRDASSAN